jgi:hypothetical protein
MIPEFDQYPIFILPIIIVSRGRRCAVCDHFEKTDFDETAIVICKHGRNIRAEERTSILAD